MAFRAGADIKDVCVSLKAGLDIREALPPTPWRDLELRLRFEKSSQ